MMQKRRAPLERSTGLKQGAPLARSKVAIARTGELARGSPLRQGSELKRGGELKRSGPLEAHRAAVARTILPVGKVKPDGHGKRAHTGIKSARPKMTRIRASARDEECTLRFPGICNCRTDTTVLCHRNGAGGAMKAPDTDAAYGCYACHAVLDGQAPRPGWLPREVMLAMFELGVSRTHVQLVAKGLLTTEAHAALVLSRAMAHSTAEQVVAGKGKAVVCGKQTTASGLTEQQRM